MANSIAVTIIFLPQRTQRTQRKNIARRTKSQQSPNYFFVMANSIAVTIIFLPQRTQRTQRKNIFKTTKSRSEAIA